MNHPLAPGERPRGFAERTMGCRPRMGYQATLKVSVNVPDYATTPPLVVVGSRK